MRAAVRAASRPRLSWEAMQRANACFSSFRSSTSWMTGVVNSSANCIRACVMVEPMRSAWSVLPRRMTPSATTASGRFSGERDRMDLMVTGISKAPGTRTTSSRADGSTAASSSEQLSTRAWVYCSLYSEATMQILARVPVGRWRRGSSVDMDDGGAGYRVWPSLHFLVARYLLFCSLGGMTMGTCSVILRPKPSSPTILRGLLVSRRSWSAPRSCRIWAPMP